ncbi:capsular polysaccharide export protein, LipB/KpsS family [Halobacillus faecis]
METYKDLTYKGYSIPYLCHFKSLIKLCTKVKTGLDSKSFSKKLKYKIHKEKDFQKIFTDYKNSYKNKKRLHDPKGKIILYNAANLLRFPNNIVEENFPTKNTAFIHDRRPSKEKQKKLEKRQKQNGKQNQQFSHYYLNEYNSGVNHEIERVRLEANKISKTFTNHPMFNDEHFRNSFDKQIKGIVNRIEEAEKFLAQVPVSCLVFSSTHYYQSRTIAIVAAKKGIPTVCMQHSILASTSVYMPKIADIDAVYGPFDVEWYKSIGVSEDSLAIIGHPRFDNVKTPPSFTKKQIEDSLGLRKGKTNILITVRKQAHVKKWTELINELITDDNLNMIVKDFPSTAPHKLTKLHPNVFSAKNIPLYDLIQHCDSVVSYTSTIGLETILKNKPAYILATPSKFDTGFYDSLGESSQLDPKALAVVIKKSLKNKAYQKEILKKQRSFLSSNYPTAEPSGKRLLQIIKELTK